MKDLKLLRWSDDGYPPIDLNVALPDVLELIREVKRLRKENEQLKEK